MCQTSGNLAPCCIKHTQGPFGTKVRRLDMCRSILSLHKIAHQMWPDHSFSQINRATERTMGVGVRDETEVGGSGWTKFEKVVVSNIGGKSS